MKKKQGLFVFLLMCALSGFSQEIKLTGVVKDSIGNVLESANIIALDKDTNSLKSYSITNAKGEYQLVLDQGNDYTLKVSFIGFESISFDVSQASAEGDMLKNFTLYEDNNQLNEVVLVYEMPITVNRDTIIYNSDSFKTGGEKKLGDILKNLPGVEINTDGQIEVEGKQVMKVMIEGKDFFDGDSKIAAENIPSDAVDKIEVLKNYGEISQLKAVTNNADNIVINLKLKEGKKNFWFGDLTAGGGEEDRFLMHPKLFYYSPKKSINIFADINNIGEIPFTPKDYYNFTGGLSKSSTSSGTSFNMSSDNLGLSLLKNNKAKAVLTKFGAANFSYSPSKSLDLSGFFIFSKNEVDLLEKSTTQYTIDHLIEQSEKASTQNITLGLAKFSSSFKPHSNFQFDYDLFVKLSKQDETKDLLSRFSDVENVITTHMNSDPFSIKQKANMYYTLNSDNILASSIHYEFAKENPFYNASFFDLGVNPSHTALPFSNIFPYNITQEDYTINQDKAIKTSKLDAKVDYYYLLNDRSNLNFSLGSTLSSQKFNSTIFQTLDDGSIENFTDPVFNNRDVTYNFTDLFLGLHYKLALGKFLFNPGISVHNYNLKNEQLGTVLSSNETIVLPNFYVNLQLQKSESLRFTYSKTAEYTDINKIAEAYVFNNYNSLFQGNRAVENGIYDKFKLSYFSSSLFNYTNVYVSLGYSKKKNAIKNNIIFNQINTLSTPINSLLADETFSAHSNWGKTFGKYKLNLKMNLVQSNYYNIINDVQQKSKVFIQNYTVSMLTKYKNAPNFEIGYQRSINNYLNANSETTFYTDKPFANVKTKFLKHFSLKSEYSFYNYQNKNQSLNTYSFWDANLYYQHEDSKWEYSLGLTNILNTSSLNQDNFNQNYSSSSQYFIQPRYAVFSIKYNL